MDFYNFCMVLQILHLPGHAYTAVLHAVSQPTPTLDTATFCTQFRNLLQTHDPTDKFRNDFLNTNIFS